MSNLDYKALSDYWSKKWKDDGIYRTDVTSDKKKLFLLVEFPYPSGEGLHVGHVRSYTAMDVIARKKRREGYEVLFPMGYDAFGLPAENYAIKTGIHPSITTRKNIDNFERQMMDCGFSFDWERTFETTDPEYYKWTQWIFLRMYEKGLAYKKEMPVNWCPKDKCVLANEEVVDGACERCGTPVEKRNKEQWMLAITKYAERLDKDLDDTTYLEKIKIQQRNWIGLSEGSEIDFEIKSTDTTFESSFTIFTTRADTLFGCTYCVLAPEHPLVTELLFKSIVINSGEVSEYKENARLKTDIDRSAEGKEKTGVKLEGVVAVNPVNNEEIPIFIADYVLPQYGTGAIMAVPAHDERDGQFAKKYNIASRVVINPVHVRDDIQNEQVVEEKNKIVAIVENKDGQILCINWGPKLGGKLFLGGTIENGEKSETTAIRELREETGYTDASVVGISEEVFKYTYYAFSKEKYYSANTTFVYIRLASDTNIGAALEENEKNKFEILWMTKNQAETEITEVLHKRAFDLFINGKGYTGEGVLSNSDQFNGITSEIARKKITEAVGGKIVIKSKLRDWVFARQRYWGEPIPVVYDKEGKMYPVSESELPIVLPMVDKYEPTDNGESPLAIISDWVNVNGRIDDTGHFISDDIGEVFRRETDTMPQWAGSSWYFMRYIDPRNNQTLGAKELLAKWLPVDWYNGGMEHTTLHLLYSRFWYKFLFDIGIVPTSEPYYKRTSQGMILGAGGVKMSKSLGNVVNPDKIIEGYGADVLRVYEMFIGPFDQSVAWDDKAIVGVSRFMDKVEKCAGKVADDVTSLPIIHQTIMKVSLDIDSTAFNTAVSSLMICMNEFEKKDKILKRDFEMFLQLLAPLAPFITEELWKNLGHTTSIHTSGWPVPDENLMVETEVTYAFQVAGKLRGTFIAPKDKDEAEVLNLLKTLDIYEKYIGIVEPKKIIFVKNRLVNVVVD